MFYVPGFRGEVQGGYIHTVLATMKSSIFRESVTIQDAILRGEHVVRTLNISPTDTRFFPIKDTMGVMLEPLEGSFRGPLVRIGGEMFPTQVRLVPGLPKQLGLHRGRDVMKVMDTLYQAANRGPGTGSIRLVENGPDRMVVVETTPYDCAFHEGLFFGVGRWFKERWTVRQLQCRHKGDAECRHEIVMKRSLPAMKLGE